MDVMIHAKLHKPDRMSNQEFFGVWKQESEAALGAVKTGGIKHIWKVAGKYDVILVVGVDTADQMDELIHGLPIWKLGYEYIVDLEWTILRPYGNWDKHLETLASE